MSEQRNLGGEPPALVYTKEGYCVWLRSTVQAVAEALVEDRK